LAVNVEMADDTRRSGIRLPTTDADGVVPWSDNWIAFVGYDAEIARLQFEMDFLACTRIEMNSFKPSKSN
jgi:hypothetical protein